MSKKSLALVALLLSLPGGVALAAPEGPRVTITPPPGKPPDLFAGEEDFCRSQAEAFTSSEPATQTIVKSAVVGALLGAAAGALMSGRHDHSGAGAVAGLIGGTLIGVEQSNAQADLEQRRYDQSYEQCMLAKGNYSGRVPYRAYGPGVRVIAPPPSPPPPYTPSTTPPPPPGLLPPVPPLPQLPSS